jgi:hypothetical protein
VLCSLNNDMQEHAISQTFAQFLLPYTNIHQLCAVI